MIVCAGMHRSGTSLFMRLLSNSDINLGKHLLGAAPDNIYGYFEDERVVNYHIKTIKKGSFGPLMANNKIHKKADLEEATLIYRTLLNDKVDAIKDPRLCLFLDVWDKVSNNEADYIFIFRNPAEVINSLLRRKTDRILYLLPWYAPISWLRYNRGILNFAESNMDRKMIFVDNDRLVSQPNRIIKLLEKKLDIEFEDDSFQNAFDSELITKGEEKSDIDYLMPKKLKNSIQKVYSGLKNLELKQFEDI